MSTLFEKAIADAKELKEAAQKNAEQMIRGLAADGRSGQFE